MQIFLHDMYNTKNAAFKELSQAAVDLLSEEKVNDIKERYRKYYEEQGKSDELTDELVQDELSAYALENVLNNKSFIRKHLNVNTEGFISSLKDKAYRTALWFKGKFSPVQRFYNALGKAYDTILEARAVINNKGQEIRFQAGKSFAEQVDDVLQGADTTSSHLQVRENTPKILQDIGLQDKPMLITSVHTLTAIGKNIKNKNIHNISETTLKKLPSLIEDPAIIMDSNKEGSIVCFVNAVDNDNNPVLCAIKINGKGNYNNIEIETNLIASVYGKETNPIGFISKAVEENRLLYWNKKMSQDLFETPGLQLPDNLKQVDSNVIIRKSKYSVNPLSENSSEKIKKVKERAALVSNQALSHEELVNTSMDMSTAKAMIERLYRIVDPNQYEESPIYKNAEDWLQKVGASEVALYADNELIIQEKYLNGIPAMQEGEIQTEEIIEGYQNKSLVGGNGKALKPVRLNVSQSVGYRDDKFYSPQEITNASRWFEIAKQRITKSNDAEVRNARAKVLLFAHNKNAANLLGVSQSELNKLLRSWSNYSTKAMQLSNRVNEGVAEENRWTGVENCAWVNKSIISQKDVERMVKSITGESFLGERRYIAATLLALDTHIDYTNINFVFGKREVLSGRQSVVGLYEDSTKTISIKASAGQNTVAHEIGHAIDYQWYNDVWNYARGYSNNSNALSRTPINLDLISDSNLKQWVKNYQAFINSITDTQDIRSEYTQDPAETFARFVARFVEFVNATATGNTFYSESSYYNDKFTGAQYLEFIKILQEKAMLDSKYLSKNKALSPAASEGREQLVAKYIKILQETRKELHNQLTKLYQGVGDSIADGVALEIGNTLFITDSGKQDGKIDFGVRKRITKSDPLKRKEFKEKINANSISKGYISRELLGKFTNAPGNNSGSIIGRKLQQKLQVNNGKSQNNQAGISKGNGNRGVSSVKERSSLTYAPTGKTNIVMDNTLNRQERRMAQKAARNTPTVSKAFAWRL